jgi:glycosyltransferase involved in cell wall biosynthesis
MSASAPLVSVVLPVYDSETWLEASIASVLGQTLRDLELILIDDGSTDGSARIIERLARCDGRVRVERHATNLGLIPSLNHGLEAAGGRFVARMDADDVCRPDRLARQVEFLEAHPEIFLVGTDAVLIDARGREFDRTWRATAPDRIAALLPRRNEITHPTIVFRRDPSLRYREKMLFTEDYDLYLRLLSRGARLANLPLPLLRYRRHAGSVSLRHAVHQRLFCEQALAFFHQRTRDGRDAYDAFDPRTILAIDPAESTDERVLRTQAIAAFALDALPEARAHLRRYFRHQGIARRPLFLAYYAAACLPAGAVTAIKRLLKPLRRVARRARRGPRSRS